MSKSEHTRAFILAQAAELFNVRGYSGTSMSDIMRATGLEKGGIYNHFPGGKESLAVEAFEYAYHQMRLQYGQILREAGKSPTAKLLAAIGSHLSMIENPVLAGGCPILNTAIESDDAHPALKAVAKDALAEWQFSLKNLAEKAEAAGELALPLTPDDLSIQLVSALEGAVMVSKLQGTSRPLRAVIAFWQNFIRSAMK